MEYLRRRDRNPLGLPRVVSVDVQITIPMRSRAVSTLQVDVEAEFRSGTVGGLIDGVVYLGGSIGTKAL